MVERVREVTVRGARCHENVVDHGPEMVGFAQDRAPCLGDERRVGCRRGRFGDDRFCKPVDPGQGSPQLVGKTGDEILLSLGEIALAGQFGIQSSGVDGSQ